jgi:hypothetical protein
MQVIFVTVPNEGKRLYVPYRDARIPVRMCHTMSSATVFNLLQLGSTLARKLLLERTPVLPNQEQVTTNRLENFCADQAEQYRPSAGYQF